MAAWWSTLSRSVIIIVFLLCIVSSLVLAHPVQDTDPGSVTHARPVEIVNTPNDRTSTPHVVQSSSRSTPSGSTSTTSNHTTVNGAHASTTHASAPRNTLTSSPGASFTGTPTNRPPRPPSPPSDPASTHLPSSHPHFSSREIFGVAIGGLAGVLVCIGFFYCVYKWKRAPPPDRTAAMVNRFRLEQEMAERTRAQFRAPLTRRSSLPEPPPPAYEHAPCYEEAPSPSSPTRLVH